MTKLRRGSEQHLTNPFNFHLYTIPSPIFNCPKQVNMEGYPQLAVFQGAYSELAIYRSSSTLNARNLLYLRAEIVDLEDQLNRYTIEDFNSDEPEKKRYSRNWYYLSRPSEGDVHNSQWHTILSIREN